MVPSSYKHRFSDDCPESAKHKLNVKVNFYFLLNFLTYKRVDFEAKCDFKEIDDYNKLIGAQQIYLRIVMKRITNNSLTIDTKEATYQVHQFFGE